MKKMRKTQKERRGINKIYTQKSDEKKPTKVYKTLNTKQET